MTAATRKKSSARKAPEKRTIPCRICKVPIEFTSGLAEMQDHWELEHPDALARLRAKLGHEEEP